MLDFCFCAIILTNKSAIKGERLGILTDWFKKEIKPVGGSAFFEAFGVPAATTLTDNINSYRGVVYACVSAIAEEVGKIEIKTYQGDNEVNTPLTKLLYDPNPEQRMTQYNLFELTQTYIELSGECFWYMAKGNISKQPLQIFILRPDKVNVVVGKNGAITGYTFMKDDGTKIPFEIEEIIHFKMPNPINPYRGMGTVQAGMVYIQTEQYASEWTRNSFYNDASPRGIVSLKGTIPDAEFNDVKRKWNKEYGGVKNANKTAILKNMDIDYTKIGVGLDEVALKEMKGMTRDDIMFMFRVSKPILGIVDDVNMANGKNANYVFMQRVIKPKMDRIVDTLQSSLGKLYGVEIHFEDPVEEDDMEKALYYEKLLNVGLTLNEIREKLGKDPIDGGDTIYQPLNLYPVGSVVTPTTEIKITKKIKAKEEIIDNKIDRKLLHWKSLNSIEIAWLRKVQLAINKVLTRQEKEVLSKIKGKAYELDPYAVDSDQFREIWIKELGPIYTELTLQTGEYAASIVGTKFVLTEAIKAEIIDRIDRTFTDFDKQTSKKISEEMMQSMVDGDNLAKMSAKINTIYGEARGYRSDRIAKTETHKIANEAAMESYKQSSVVTEWEWYANPGACGFCQSMSGSKSDLNSPMMELGSSVKDAETGQEMTIDYEPITSADLHPNCQCTQLPTSQEYRETGHFGNGDENETIV